jgi:hypothetical protein
VGGDRHPIDVPAYRYRAVAARLHMVHTLEATTSSTVDTDMDTTAAGMIADIAVDDAGPARVGAPPLVAGPVALRGRVAGRWVLVTVAVALGEAALAVVGAALGCLLTGTVLTGLSRHDTRRLPDAGMSSSGR